MKTKLLAIVSFCFLTYAQGRGFTVDQILGFPSPDNLIASPVDSTIAWTFDERGVRNIYTATGREFEAHRVTAYTQDDGLELTQLAFSHDGKTIVYVRGGDHGNTRGDREPPNPAGLPVQPKIQIWSVAATGGTPRLIGDGDEPALAPDSDRVAFIRKSQVWIAPLDGSKEPQQLFYARGTSGSLAWSPDGKTLAFVSNRTDHSFIGIYTPAPDQLVRFIAPSTSRDTQPVWSMDGRKIAFLRQPGTGGTPRSPVARVDTPWSLMVADLPASRSENIPAKAVVTSGESPIDPIVQNPSGIGIHWAADDTLVFMSYRDGFPHLYALQHPGSNSQPRLLTRGSFMVEQFVLTPDRRSIVFTANTGSDPNDIDRRHLYALSLQGTPQRALTSGTGIEWSPVVTANGQVGFLKSSAQKPPAPAVLPSTSGGGQINIAGNLLAKDYPSAELATPQLVRFRASDGVEAHGQLFKGSAGPARRPAVVYIHGGGPRQMLLGFHNRWEYANDYAANEYLVSRGFIVLSVDYRLSVGYGQAYQFAENTGPRGAEEYRDILAGGKYLQALPDVDPNRIGVWGASLGGYLTDLALARNSDVFAAGVAVHGVEDRLPAVSTTTLAHAIVGDGVTEADLKKAMQVEFQSSPIASIKTWKSPALLIHGDADRTVEFHQTVDLKQRLVERGVKVEEVVLPDDVHDSLLWRNWTTSISAMAEFFERTLQPKRGN